MSHHLKRYCAPGSWHIARKTRTFIMKTAPGPHNKNAVPIGVWLRDHMGYARNMKEVTQILHQGDLILNGRVCRDPHIGIGIFDIIALPKIGAYYRIIRDKNGRHRTVPIDQKAAESRLCKILNKTVVKGGKVQLNLRFGANLLADHTYRAGDSIVLSLKDEDRFRILDHFPFREGNMAMVIGGKHSGRIARVVRIVSVPGSVPDRVMLRDDATGEEFDTIEPYIYMVGRENPAIPQWGIE